MRMLACALMTLCLAACATASPAPVATPPPAPVVTPLPPIPPTCRPDLLTPAARPGPLPEVMTVRDGLMIGVADRALALTNALLSGELQACVSDLIAQRSAQ